MDVERRLRDRLGHNSMIFMIKAQARYAVQAIKAIRRRKLTFLDVRETGQRCISDRLQEDAALRLELGLPELLRGRRLQRHHVAVLYVPVLVADPSSGTRRLRAGGAGGYHVRAHPARCRPGCAPR